MERASWGLHPAHDERDARILSGFLGILSSIPVALRIHRFRVRYRNVDIMGSEAQIHLSFFFKALNRVLKPGRVAIVHVCRSLA